MYATRFSISQSIGNSSSQNHLPNFFLQRLGDSRQKFCWGCPTSPRVSTALVTLKELSQNFSASDLICSTNSCTTSPYQSKFTSRLLLPSAAADTPHQVSSPTFAPETPQLGHVTTDSDFRRSGTRQFFFRMSQTVSFPPAGRSGLPRFSGGEGGRHGDRELQLLLRLVCKCTLPLTG